jgi:hypothetical protein
MYRIASDMFAGSSYTCESYKRRAGCCKFLSVFQSNVSCKGHCVNSSLCLKENFSLLFQQGSDFSAGTHGVIAKLYTGKVD